ncbi:hypothetical protein B0H19DRAFT_1230225 [Mycena capillaripes]|nr:hypothetical protein B0H19DRAFT_1230225 [Mycena capillaripes]
MTKTSTTHCDLLAVYRDPRPCSMPPPCPYLVHVTAMPIARLFDPPPSTLPRHTAPLPLRSSTPPPCPSPSLRVNPYRAHPRRPHVHSRRRRTAPHSTPYPPSSTLPPCPSTLPLPPSSTPSLSSPTPPPHHSAPPRLPAPFPSRTIRSLPPTRATSPQYLTAPSPSPAAHHRNDTHFVTYLPFLSSLLSPAEPVRLH